MIADKKKKKKNENPYHYTGHLILSDLQVLSPSVMNLNT